MATPNTPGGNTPPPAPAPTPQLITLTMEQFQEMLAATKGNGGGGDMQTLADAIAKGMAANAPRKFKTAGEYAATERTIYHPDPTKRQKLSRATFQNGAMCNERSLFDEEIALLNRITHSGRYIDRRVEVSVRDTGGGDEVLHVSYNNKKDKLSELFDLVERTKGQKSKFQSLLQMVVDAQELEDLEREEHRQRIVRR